MRRKVFSLFVLAVLSTACRVEWRANELWACRQVQTAVGPVEACQPTGLRIQ